jgi:hypothetical protein
VILHFSFMYRSVHYELVTSSPWCDRTMSIQRLIGTVLDKRLGAALGAWRGLGALAAFGGGSFRHLIGNDPVGR